MYSPRSPIPRKSVLGSSPWKPISHHCLVIRDSNGVLGFKNFHNWRQERKLAWWYTHTNTLFYWLRFCKLCHLRRVLWKLNTCKYITIKDLIIFQWSNWNDSSFQNMVWRFLEGPTPWPLQKVWEVKNISNKNNRLFAFSLSSSHEYTVEFFRGCMTCDHGIPLKATEYALLHFCVWNICFNF